MKTVQSIFICSLVLIFLLSSCEPVPPERLTSEQIAELRRNYPVIQLNPIVEYSMLSIVELSDMIELIAQIEVTEILPDYQLKISSSELSYHQFKATIKNLIINNSNNAITSEIIICAGGIENHPEFYVGSDFIFALESSALFEGCYLYDLSIAYYVTDTDYVLPVSDELGNDIYSGMKRTNFIELLIKSD